MNAAKIALALMMVPASAGLMSMTGCSSEPSTPAEKANLTDDGQTRLTALKREYKDLDPLIQSSYGYAIFPHAAKGGLVISGGGGRGTVYEQGKYVGTAGLTQGSIGLTAGGQDFTELLVFQNKDAMDSFKGNRVSFDANASAVALKAGASATPDYKKGIAVFTVANSGLMAEASIGGQQFTFTADTNSGM